MLASPSVFNFYLPDYQPIGAIADNDLVAPEMQIHTSATSVNYINLVHEWFIDGYLGEVSTTASNTVMNTPGYEFNELKYEDELKLDLTDELALANNPMALINRLDLILTGGLFSEETKDSIVSAIDTLSSNEDRVRAALYLSFISPDFNIQK